MKTTSAYTSHLNSNSNSFSKATNILPAVQHNNTQNSTVPKGKFNPALAVVVISLVLSFLLVGLISGHLKRCIRRLGRGGGEVIRPSVDRPRAEEELHHGLDKQVVEALPLVQYQDLPADEQVKYNDCSVCLVAFDAADTLRLLPTCSHVFHLNCIGEWFLSHNTCPLCRVCLAHSTHNVGTVDVGHHLAQDDRIRLPEDSDILEVVVGGDGELDGTIIAGILETPQDGQTPGTFIANTFASSEHFNRRSIPWDNILSSFKPPVRIVFPPEKIPLSSIRRTSSAGTDLELAINAHVDDDDSLRNSATLFHATGVEYCIPNEQNRSRPQVGGSWASTFVRSPVYCNIEDSEDGSSKLAGKMEKMIEHEGDLQRVRPTTRWSFPNLRQIAPI